MVQTMFVHMNKEKKILAKHTQKNVAGKTGCLHAEN
jgi:hypothetical protein